MRILSFVDWRRVDWRIKVSCFLLPVTFIASLYCLFKSYQSTRLTTEAVQFGDVSNWLQLAALSVLLSLVLCALFAWGWWHSSQVRRASGVVRAQQEQAAMLVLLDEITPLAQGDLRVQATVSEATIGAVADAFNYAVGELRRLVMAVTESADFVKSSVDQTRHSADELARASSVQAREIHRSSNYLNVMSDTMAQLSANAVDSSRIADQSVVQARTGGDAVEANVQALTRIREQADVSTRMMERLLDSTKAINARVDEINTLAKRTDLLALNTTIKASAAYRSSSAVGIAQISDDVAHLSDALSRASGDIGRLSSMIHQDALLTLESMQRTTKDVDSSCEMAQQASVSLSAIELVSSELNELISEIASKSLRQAGVVKQLSANMGVINNITRESSLGMQGSAQALERLQKITSELRDSVADFSLPASATRPGSAAHRSSLQRAKASGRAAKMRTLQDETVHG